MPHTKPRRALLCSALLLSLIAGPRAVSAVAPGALETSGRGFPTLRDSSGKRLANGDFLQWVENGRLHIKLVYDFGGGRRIEERAVLRQRPQLVQEQWSWSETRNGSLYRRFAVDMVGKKATAAKLEDKGMKEWSDDVDLEPGKAFGGIGFTYAIKNLRSRLLKGEAIELQAVGFMPKPRAADVELTHAGVDRMRMADRSIRGDRYVIHPKLPWIADLFVDVPDTTIWLTPPPAVMFLRVEGPLAEPKDPAIRVDLLPGGGSGPAQQLRAGVRQRKADDQRASR